MQKMTSHVGIEISEVLLEDICARYLKTDGTYDHQAISAFLKGCFKKSADIMLPSDITLARVEISVQKLAFDRQSVSGLRLVLSGLNSEDGLDDGYIYQPNSYEEAQSSGPQMTRSVKFSHVLGEQIALALAQPSLSSI